MNQLIKTYCQTMADKFDALAAAANALAKVIAAGDDFSAPSALVASQINEMINTACPHGAIGEHVVLSDTLKPMVEKFGNVGAAVAATSERHIVNELRKFGITCRRKAAELRGK